MYQAYRELLWKRLPVMMFTSVYSAVNGSVAFASIAVYMLYLNGFSGSASPFGEALTAIAYLAGYTAAVSSLATILADALPTVGIFQRIANGLQKLKDVLSTYEYFDDKYECIVLPEYCLACTASVLAVRAAAATLQVAVCLLACLLAFATRCH